MDGDEFFLRLRIKSTMRRNTQERVSGQKIEGELKQF